MGRPFKKRQKGNVAPVIAGSESMAAAARRLGVHRSTVLRWKRQGEGRTAAVLEAERVEVEKGSDMEPGPWGEMFRKEHTLTSTELELVVLAERALKLAKDETQNPVTQLQAMARFQALVRQVTASSYQASQPTTQRSSAAGKPVTVDPRALLMAAK